MDILISTDWLATQLGQDDLKILDASLFLPGTPRDPRAEFEAAHPGPGVDVQFVPWASAHDQFVTAIGGG